MRCDVCFSLRFCVYDQFVIFFLSLGPCCAYPPPVKPLNEFKTPPPPHPCPSGFPFQPETKGRFDCHGRSHRGSVGLFCRSGRGTPTRSTRASGTQRGTACWRPAPMTGPCTRARCIFAGLVMLLSSRFALFLEELPFVSQPFPVFFLHISLHFGVTSGFACEFLLNFLFPQR